MKNVTVTSWNILGLAIVAATLLVLTSDNAAGRDLLDAFVDLVDRTARGVRDVRLFN